jgi:hypothetical protein
MFRSRIRYTYAICAPDEQIQVAQAIHVQVFSIGIEFGDVENLGEGPGQGVTVVNGGTAGSIVRGEIYLFLLKSDHPAISTWEIQAMRLPPGILASQHKKRKKDIDIENDIKEKTNMTSLKIYKYVRLKICAHWMCPKCA